MWLEGVTPEDFAEVISDLLHRAAPEERVKILKLAVAKEEKEEAERQAGDPNELRVIDAGDLANMEFRCWRGEMAIKAAVAYTFVRDITNNHSHEEAARLLFREHRTCPGSGHLDQYLEWEWVKAEAHQRRNTQGDVVEKWAPKHRSRG
jgi:hypothetical protein